MAGKMQKAAVIVPLLWIACAGRVYDRFGGEEELIRTEWAAAQVTLESRGVERAHLVPPDICKFVPVQGKFATDVSPTGWANGLFNGGSFTIWWNVETPHVLQHEAGHAILKFLDYPCWHCYEHGCEGGPEDCP